MSHIKIYLSLRGARGRRHIFLDPSALRLGVANATEPSRIAGKAPSMNRRRIFSSTTKAASPRLSAVPGSRRQRARKLLSRGGKTCRSHSPNPASSRRSTRATQPRRRSDPYAPPRARRTSSSFSSTTWALARRASMAVRALCPLLSGWRRTASSTPAFTRRRSARRPGRRC
jgi:hypothetical protein